MLVIVVVAQSAEGLRAVAEDAGATLIEGSVHAFNELEFEDDGSYDLEPLGTSKPGWVALAKA